MGFLRPFLAYAGLAADVRDVTTRRGHAAATGGSPAVENGFCAAGWRGPGAAVRLLYTAGISCLLRRLRRLMARRRALLFSQTQRYLRSSVPGFRSHLLPQAPLLATVRRVAATRHVGLSWLDCGQRARQAR